MALSQIVISGNSTFPVRTAKPGSNPASGFFVHPHPKKNNKPTSQKVFLFKETNKNREPTNRRFALFLDEYLKKKMVMRKNRLFASFYDVNKITVLACWLKK